MWVSNHTTRLRSLPSKQAALRRTGSSDFHHLLDPEVADAAEVSLLEESVSSEGARSTDPLPTLWWLSPEPEFKPEETLASLRHSLGRFAVDPSASNLAEMEELTEAWLSAPLLSMGRREALKGLRLRLAIARAKMD
jgi:hypothetical protein